MKRQSWTRDQLLRTLALYCQIPFGKMHARNPAVAALAQAIGRTPAAVALKLVNFASLDPDLQERSIGGMPNTSVADRAVWDEFYGKWDVLAEYVSSAEFVDQPDSLGQTIPPAQRTGPTEALVETRQRRGQSFFRAAVLAAYDGKCCITGITAPALLRASHIIPWSRDASVRLDPHNGLCMNALHDAAFDRGLITLTPTYELKMSNRLKHDIPSSVYSEMFASRADRPIALPERFMPSPAAIEFHRTKVFQNT